MGGCFYSFLFLGFFVFLIFGFYILEIRFLGFYNFGTLDSRLLSLFVFVFGRIHL